MYEGAVTEAGLPEQPAHPIGGAEGGAYDEQLAAQFLQTMQKTRDGDNFSKLEKGVGGGGMLLYQTNGDFYRDTLKWHPAHTVFKWNMFNRDLNTKHPDNVNSRDRNCKHLSSHTSPVSESTGTQFKISVYYRGVKVLEQMVENEAGVRLVYR